MYGVEGWPGWPRERPESRLMDVVEEDVKLVGLRGVGSDGGSWFSEATPKENCRKERKKLKGMNHNCVSRSACTVKHLIFEDFLSGKVARCQINSMLLFFGFCHFYVFTILSE